MIGGWQLLKNAAGKGIFGSAESGFRGINEYFIATIADIILKPDFHKS